MKITYKKPKPKGGVAPCLATLILIETTSGWNIDESHSNNGRLNISLTNGLLRVVGLNPGTKYTLNMQKVFTAEGATTLTYSKVTTVSASTAKYTAPRLTAVARTATADSIMLSYTPSPAKVAGAYTVGYELQVLQGKSLITMLTSPDGQNWTDAGGTELTAHVLDGGKIQVEGLPSANMKYTFSLQAIAVGADGHTIQSLASKVSVKTAK